MEVVGSGVDDDKLRDSVGKANVPVLLMVLVHLTGDLRWIRPPFTPTRPRGMDDNDSGGLAPELQQEVRQAALSAIVRYLKTGDIALPDPSPELLVRMLSVCMGEVVPSEFGPRVLAALEPVLHPDLPSPPRLEFVPKDFTAIIIGAGFSGLCAAVKLAERGIPFTVIEKQSTVGGTWFNHRYPGAAVDTAIHIYSYSFAPYDWPRYFALRKDVHDYLEHIATQFDLRPHIRLATEVIAARYHSSNQHWRVEIRDQDGVHESLETSVIISAVGAFNPPKVPDIPGQESFGGDIFHTAQWPDKVDLRGQRVALVGNGASAMQVGPAIVDDVGSLTIFQRSPQWVAPFPKFRAEVPEETRYLLKTVPLYSAWYRERLGWAFGDRIHMTLQKDPAWAETGSINARNKAYRRLFEQYLRSELGDREDLIAQTLPPFPPYAKRMLLDNGWFRTLTRPHVALETRGIEAITRNGVLTTSGQEYEVDSIIFATGYDISRFLSTFEVRGRNNLSLREFWEEDDAQAYLGLAVPNFPNLFMLYGPNTQPGGGGSLLYNVESQVHYIVELMTSMIHNAISVVECKPEVYKAFNERTVELHEKMIYTYPGVSGYYRNSRGRVVVNTPLRNVDFWYRTRTPDLNEFNIEAPAYQNGLESGVTASLEA